jgi:hypothetical protein
LKPSLWNTAALVFVLLIYNFREKGFAVDWCAFRLLILDEEVSSEDTTAIYKEVTIPSSSINDNNSEPVKPSVTTIHPQ